MLHTLLLVLLVLVSVSLVADLLPLKPEAKKIGWTLVAVVLILYLLGWI